MVRIPAMEEAEKNQVIKNCIRKLCKMVYFLKHTISLDLVGCLSSHFAFLLTLACIQIPCWLPVEIIDQHLTSPQKTTITRLPVKFED